MSLFIGIAIVMSMVFGGYVLAGGKFAVILYALPFEAMMIIGASFGAFIIANPGPVVKATAKSFVKVIKGAKYKKEHYLDLLALMFVITKTIKTKGMLFLESHIENPEESTIFNRYPSILHDHHTIVYICDTLRLLSMNYENPYQVDDLLTAFLERHHHEALAPADSLTTVADGMPALGIVAAVLGVIKTMSSITEPPEILGKMIGGALVGTFLGVFCAYCFFGPIAQKVRASIEEESAYFRLVKDIIITHLQGYAPQISIEIARNSIPSVKQPSFAEVEEKLNAVSSAAAA